MTVVTRLLWNSLYYPPRKHPLFRAMCEVWKPQHMLTRRDLMIRVLMVLGFAGVFFVAPVVVIVSCVLIAILTPVVVIFLNGTLFGLYWSVLATQAINDLRKRYSWDLLEVSPLSAFGGAWLTAIGRIHRGKTFEESFTVLTGMVITVELALVIIVLVLMLSTRGLEPNRVVTMGETVGDVIRAMAIILTVWFDHIQSILLGCLTSLLGVRVFGNQPMRVVGTGALYLGIKLSAFIVAMMCYSLADTLLGRLLSGQAYIILTGLVFPCMYFLVFEATINIVWRLAASKYQG